MKERSKQGKRGDDVPIVELEQILPAVDDVSESNELVTLDVPIVVVLWRDVKSTWADSICPPSSRKRKDIRTRQPQTANVLSPERHCSQNCRGSTTQMILWSNDLQGSSQVMSSHHKMTALVAAALAHALKLDDE